MKKAIGVFDSGYGGLAVLKEIVALLPEYDYLYLGDNARVPYGTKSQQTVYNYTLECVEWILKQGCDLVILACNTASASALRTIQQNDLPRIDKNKRILGVLRPTTEVIGNLTSTGEIGILGTNRTVDSNSYPIEIEKFFPGLKIQQLPCPMWVPLVENGEYDSTGADYFIKRDINLILGKGKNIDALLLACTHYPLLRKKIEKYLPEGVKLITQGEIVAKSLENYLFRHPEIENKLNKQGQIEFYTTDSTEDFDKHGTIFFGKSVKSKHLSLT